MPTHVVNRPTPAVPGTSASSHLSAEAPAVGLFPRIAHGLWPMLGGRGPTS